MRPFVFFLGLSTTFFWPVCPSLALEFSSSSPPDAFSKQGKELRSELERVYRDSKGKKDSLAGLAVSSTVARIGRLIEIQPRNGKKHFGSLWEQDSSSIDRSTMSPKSPSPCLQMFREIQKHK